jgi:hypothetical protein
MYPCMEGSPCWDSLGVSTGEILAAKGWPDACLFVSAALVAWVYVRGNAIATHDAIATHAALEDDKRRLSHHSLSTRYFDLIAAARLVNFSGGPARTTDLKFEAIANSTDNASELTGARSMLPTGPEESLQFKMLYSFYI